MRDRLALVLLLSLFAGVTSAKTASDYEKSWMDFDREFDADAKPWVEIAAAFPAPPREENLVPFEVGPATKNRFYVDRVSVSVGGDRVVRYTAVVKAAGGATNVSFEGMRCDTREHKLYAFGHPDGTWSRAREAGWRHIPGRGANYARTLYEEFFCPGGVVVRNVGDAQEALRRGGKPD